ncbi:MarR family winged helix-turn-helix transcriptional regulator [Actinorugispora endophytica]|uniref:MarR family transcriptional regulator n=1 Tax=Actinorugispora endophytica TaxID=1605990 RepID=A0A4V3D883_9ACTN|nr:MarR family transcriptional regulator [Actinorugispora endophytica]TDQ50737.1 MarR family transcriptional regulator [Actinorugispora endophytica]
MVRNRLAEQAWESLARTQVALMRRFQEDFRAAGVPMRVYDVLCTLSRHPGGRIRLRDLNEHILLTQPSVSRLVERMEADGLVSRGGAPEDRRGTVVTITGEGRELLRVLGRDHAAAIADHVGTALTPDELRTLRALADKLRAAQRAARHAARFADGPR